MLHIKILPIINLLRIQVVVCHAVPSDFLPAGARRNAVLRVAGRLVIHIATNGAA